MWPRQIGDGLCNLCGVPVHPCAGTEAVGLMNGIRHGSRDVWAAGSAPARPASAREAEKRDKGCFQFCDMRLSVLDPVLRLG
jgi:hypothetical protein